ncbi:LacI family DNA-binding transcriptional regulator [Mesorhizobium sp. BAC0120]|uniref:LacI family DNA-binding transcriptional regulator n=1 Tax=Mesorhizobium sp. BAC0120 TaxID=3090670 RepID=UPI00298D1A0F|nr:LacI family DNA-binding transcriptional regulator [Mesorhizobium sp. BAC0120]MDW6025800.1 LacI family DNA-binding transcriptional regulator [Mesorhizobium sp. BAC0120]
MATIKDVARHAGVAISTVSAVLNRSAPVSEQAVEKVAKAIAAVGYVPHGAARSLRSGNSQLIGLVVPNIANPHFAAVAREIENICLAAGYMSVVYSTGQDPERESQVLKMLRVQRVAGLIIIPTRSDAEHGGRLVDQIGVPTVLLDMFVEGLPYHVIKTDNIEAGRLATDHLLELGHRRIGIIAGIPGLATSDDRLAGYRKAYAEHGISPEPSLEVAGNFDQAEAHDRAIELLQRPDRPTAIVTISNMMTLGLLFAVRELRMKVPEELSIVGIDDLEIAGVLDPAPTVVVTPILAMSRRAIEMLLKQIAHKQAATGGWEIHQPYLLVRDSTRALD